MRSFLPSLAFFGAIIISSVAYADPMGPISGSGGGFSGTGTLYAASNGDGSYFITDISGTGVVGLINVGGFNSNDNLLFPNGSSLVDSNGFSFNDAQGDTSFNVNIYSVSDGIYYAYITDSDSLSQNIPITLSISDDGPIDGPSEVHSFNSLRHGNANMGTTEAFDFSIGTPSITPEPSSLVLLGTGILGAAGAMGRRLFRRAS